MKQKKKRCAPNIGSNYVDALDHRPEDGCTNLGMCREADGNECAAGAEIVNRLLVCSALYVEVLWIAIRCPLIQELTLAAETSAACGPSPPVASLISFTISFVSRKSIHFSAPSFRHRSLFSAPVSMRLCGENGLKINKVW